MLKIFIALTAVAFVQNALATPLPDVVGNREATDGDFNRTNTYHWHRYHRVDEPVVQPAVTTVAVERPSLLDSIPIVGPLLSGLPVVGPLVNGILGGSGGVLSGGGGGLLGSL